MWAGEHTLRSVCELVTEASSADSELPPRYNQACGPSDAGYGFAVSYDRAEQAHCEVHRMRTATAQPYPGEASSTQLPHPSAAEPQPQSHTANKQHSGRKRGESWLTRSPHAWLAALVVL